jgi:hypothetical protein
MLSLFASKKTKGQFFIISAIIVVISLVAIGGYLASYGRADPSIPISIDETFIFWNIKDQLNKTAHAYDCPELKNNLLEFEYLVEKNLADRGYHLNLTFEDPCTGPSKQPFNVTMQLRSSRVQMYDKFILPA